MKMRSTYILEHKTVDKLGRFKKAVHIGDFKTLDSLDADKKSKLDNHIYYLVEMNKNKKD